MGTAVGLIQMKTKTADLKAAETRERIWAVVASLNGCQVTARQIRTLLDGAYAEGHICKHIRMFMDEGRLEDIKSTRLGTIIRVKNGPGDSPRP